ncbi:hypothetical protein EG328_002148 [Venturia inaequalis]|uniref:Major facilitator superfamily (MFS) profile domain-containing protein n=1 Tax=Venturia inaequalis TaxID=5025 RepID=A0A8H3UXV5_VENIN|nr:hypothetical protein EG328_002148 [Venturia inaequalis]
MVSTAPPLSFAPQLSLSLATTNEPNKATEDAASNQEKETIPPADEEEVEDTTHHVHGLARFVLVFGLCVTSFLIGLDQLIIATAIPKITTLFHSLEDVGWYGSAFLLCTTSLQPSFGKIYTYFDVKWTYVIALITFEVGSVLCAAANSSKMFIIGRAVAGGGAAGLFGGSMNMIAYAIPMRQRGMFLSLTACMTGIASIAGPLLGGIFTDRLSWRWCFWINLPFGGIAVLIVFFFFKNPARDYDHLSLIEKIQKVDLPGAFFLITSIICLLLALQWGGLTYAWKNSKVWGCLLGFGLLFIVFTALQIRRGENATIPPHIVKKRTVLASAMTLFLLAMGTYVHIYYLPFYFQSVKGTTAEQSGIRCLPYIIAQTAATVIAGVAVTFVGWYTPFIYFGTVLLVVGSGLIYTLSPTSSPAQWIGYQAIAGFGAGSAMGMPFLAVQVVLSTQDMPSGNAISMFFNTIGGAIGISIAQNIFSNTLVKEIPIYVKSVDVHTVINAGAQGFRNVVDPSEVAGTILAYNKSVTTAFVLAIAVSAMAVLTGLLFEWRSVKGKKVEVASGGA